MSKKIKYNNHSKVAGHEAYRTEKFGNLLSDAYQGAVDSYSEGDWSGWVINLSNSDNTDFRLGFKSKAAATRWVNARLRKILR